MSSPNDQPPPTPRPAATVMLVRDDPESPGGSSVFLMRRHSAMEFAAGVTVFRDTYFFVGALPEGQRADGENTESDSAGWTTPQAAIDDFAGGRCFLLPPTWTQLDSLAGRTVADVSAVERQIVTVQPNLQIDGDTWVFEFFGSDRYHRARKAGGLGWRL
ncbi:hypothetical protein [Candidatus Mycobacterium methanotrophicum]|uniref:NUDIX hydrolase n=1 Tax=Candidatus Mycobacterium methanotrophicum TaxID=2943498 RepID=A0ABY4QME6_9MYCO|nr:hypothetical protein [Candidatus Mycobacterium methanotrophicum]UQX11801.1 hypothetical protein M5I08_05085 [Candidatus Mycobacterium methanotrophicum]